MVQFVVVEVKILLSFQFGLYAYHIISRVFGVYLSVYDILIMASHSK